MNTVIETEALKAFLLGILSCKCPVTIETERRLFEYYAEFRQSENMDFSAILAIADKNPERTPVRNLFEFCAGAKDDPLRFVITVNDVLRYLGSFIHYNMVISNNPGIDKKNPELLISHLLVPVTLEKKGDFYEGVYENKGAFIRFSPVLIPVKPVDLSGYYAHHMGMVLCRLSEEQTAMLNSHQGLIPGFKDAANSVGRISLRALPPLGDHFSQVIERFDRYDI